MAKLTVRQMIRYGREFYTALDEMRREGVRLDDVTRETHPRFYQRLNALPGEDVVEGSLFSTINSMVWWTVGGLSTGPIKCARAARYHRPSRNP